MQICESVYPLLKSGVEEMLLSLSDLPTFCGCVLPETQDSVTIDDLARLLQEYLPDECVPCFRFDMDGEALTLRLDFRYDNL